MLPFLLIQVFTNLLIVHGGLNYSLYLRRHRNQQFQNGSADLGEFGVATAPAAMSITLDFLVEGGGANKRIGISKLHFGDAGNLTADNAKVNYSTSGIAVEVPGGPLPMNDAPDDNPTGGDTIFRNNSSESSTNASNGGKTIHINSDDQPGFGPFLVVHPSTNHTWATTEGGYDFIEFIVGYSETFPRAYFVVAKANWTVRFVGSRNSSGIWIDGASQITLQGMNQDSASFTVTVTNGSPQTGDNAGIQVLGLSYALNHSPSYS